MRALTIWQPWASLIMIGAKPIEWRSWYAPRAHHGQRIVIHAGTRAVRMGEVEQLLVACKREWLQVAAGELVDEPTAMRVGTAIPFLEQVRDGTIRLPIAAGLGTAILGEPRLAADHGYPVDSDRLDQQNWGWPLTDVEPFAEPIPLPGARGFWTWPEAMEWAA